MSLFILLCSGLAHAPFLGWEPFSSANVPLLSSTPWVLVKHHPLEEIFKHAPSPNTESAAPPSQLTKPHFMVWNAMLIFVTLERMHIFPPDNTITLSLPTAYSLCIRFRVRRRVFKELLQVIHESLDPVSFPPSKYFLYLM